jgi:hypothetical protein
VQAATRSVDRSAGTATCLDFMDLMASLCAISV